MLPAPECQALILDREFRHVRLSGAFSVPVIEKLPRRRNHSVDATLVLGQL